LIFTNLWLATCNELSVRITLKLVNGGMASNPAAATKGSGRSFLDALAQASSSAANKPALTVAAAMGSTSDTPDRDSEDQASGQPVAASENEAVDAQEISIAGSTIHKSAPVTAGQQNQGSETSPAVLASGNPASSTRSQSQAKASQPAQNQVTDSIAQTGDQGAAQQNVVSLPAVTLSASSFSRSSQSEAASPTVYAKRPSLPAVLQSNAISTSQTGGNGADASQSPAPASTSPAVTLSEISSGRSIQSEAASPAASAKRPSLPAVLQSNAISTSQTGGNGADASQSQAPASASPAVTLSGISFGRSTQWGAASPTASAERSALPMVQQPNASSNAQVGNDNADASQIPVSPSASSAVTLSEISFGRSMQWDVSSPVASAKRPALPAVLQSNANSIAQNGSDGADASQSKVPVSASPAVMLSTISFGRSMQSEAASPTASADLPAFTTTPSSNANSIPQTGSNGADASQSQVSVSAASSGTLPNVSLGRSMQRVAASPTVSADLPAITTTQPSNANSIAQTGSDGADASQSPVPAATSPAATDLSFLAGGSAAQFIEQSAFAVGSTFSPGMILPVGDGAGTLTDKASQFKSSGATFTVNSGDANSSKVSSAQGSISADHSSQNANPLSQHAPGDSSTATPLAIKPVEASVAQTIPVSNHTALASPSQPHAASGTSDVLTKAQDSADAAAEQLERTGSAAAAGINTARLLQTMSESEMRVGMHSAEFGDISIRTSVSQAQVMAQINVDHSELGSAIAAHLPSLESKLGSEFGLHASFEVNQLGGSFTGGNGQPSHENYKATSQSVPVDSSTLNAEDDRIPLPGQSLEVEDSRLDIRV
jgi:hypothetical protein